ncbi:hypothetical protein [Persephonella sp.]
MSYVLEPLTKESIQNVIGLNENGKKVIKYYIQVAVFSQPEVLPNQGRISIKIPKEHIEQWFVQALKVKHVGSGNSPIDIKKENMWGADVKSMQYPMDENGDLTKGETNETSIIQDFKGVGKDLDEAFKSGEFNKIKNGYVKALKKKLLESKKAYKVNDIYYFIILIGQKKFYLLVLKVNIDLLDGRRIKLHTKKKGKGKSLYLKKIIKDNYGSVKVYKSKKRMELRLIPINLYEDGYLIEFNIPAFNRKISIYELIQNRNKYNYYIKTKFKKIFNLNF